MSLSPKESARAKARARAAGRPYPNAFDNMVAGGAKWREGVHKSDDELVNKKLPSALRASGREIIEGRSIPKFKNSTNKYIQSRQIAAAMGEPRFLHETGDIAARASSGPRVIDEHSTFTRHASGNPERLKLAVAMDNQAQQFADHVARVHARKTAINTQVNSGRILRDESRKLSGQPTLHEKNRPTRIADLKEELARRQSVNKADEDFAPYWSQVGIPARRVQADPISPLAMYASSRIMVDNAAALMGRNLNKRQKKRAGEHALQIAGARGLVYSPLGMIG
jgi:hypothetical protein